MPEGKSDVRRISLDGPDWWINGKRPNEWLFAKTFEQDPPGPGWLPAIVPGSVQDDLLDQGRIPDPEFERQSEQSEWTADRDWTYARAFTLPEDLAEAKGGRWALSFGGVDYHAHVFLNGEKLTEHEGTFIPFDVDVTSRLRTAESNRLTVVVERAPREEHQIGYTGKVRTWKPRFAYGWDWCTRMIPLGIWGSVELVRDEGLRITDLCVRPQVAEDLASAEVLVTAKYTSTIAAEGRATIALEHEGETAGEWDFDCQITEGNGEVTASFHLDAPQLWWPNGHGEQPLYQVKLCLSADGVRDCADRRIGFRRCRFVSNGGAPPDALPYTAEVNGKRIYLKGWNWAPIHHLYRRQSAGRYERLVGLAAAAHVTMLRVWGGGLLERELFYDLCDEAGILVWQSFCQSSSGLQNAPPRDAEYLNMALRHAEAMIPQRRHHPSLAIWCGGNELMDDDWVPLDSTHPALAVLEECVERLDPDRHYLPTSASGPVANASLDNRGKMHDVHGPWLYGGLKEHYTLHNSIDPLLHSEYGCEGAARERALRRFISPENLWPPDKSNEMWAHHGDWWINLDRVEPLMGEIGNIRNYVRLTQFLQADGLRYATEANRRRKWRCSGTLPWQFAEPWPNASCTSCIDAYGQPKPAYYWMRKAYEAVHASARHEGVARHDARELICELHVSSSLDAARACELSAVLYDMHGRAMESQCLELMTPANASAAVGEFRWQAPKDFDGLALLRLELSEDDSSVLSRNEYLFTWHEPPELAALRQLPATRLEIEELVGGLSVTNAGGVLAYFVSLEPANDAEWAILDDSFFCLLPGETRRVQVTGHVGRFVINGWNCRTAFPAQGGLSGVGE